ncbi:unnamed protein product [Orchesella dallaii]|uniref:Odorant receptor n=1 Tax=Orchesella dallaii TaxID=48710 RepID=A0ABP1RUK3_9HEXA
MIVTNQIKKLIYWRIQVMKYICFATPYDWDPVANEYTSASIYLQWNTLLFTASGSLIPIILAIYSISNLYQDAEDFEENSSLVLNPATLPTTIIGFIISSAFSMVLVSASRVLACNSSMLFAKIQLIRYSSWVEDLLKKKQLELDNNCKKAIRHGEYLFSILWIFTTAVPVFIGGLIFNEYDPINNLLKDWFEITISGDIYSVPFVLLLIWGAMNGGSACFGLLGLPLMYLWTSIICVSSLIPRNVQQIYEKADKKFHCKISTKSFGLLEEKEVVIMYRTQQIFDGLVNEIFSSLLVSSHHAALMAILVGFSILAITATEAVLAAGPLLWVVGAAGPFVVIAIVFIESTKIGEMVDISEEFVKKGLTLTSTRTSFGKFLKSCRHLTINSAHPFYCVRKGTFLKFFHHYLDFLTSILLSLSTLN